MATKPDAARGKTTRKGKIKKFQKTISNILERQPTIKDPGDMYSPGAMGGRTRREFNPPKPTRSDLETLFKRSDEVATKIGGIMGTAGKAFTKQFKKDGGEVMDLTTEVDVE